MGCQGFEDATATGRLFLYIPMGDSYANPNLRSGSHSQFVIQIPSDTSDSLLACVLLEQLIVVL
jgi:hypothetical protein